MYAWPEHDINLEVQEGVSLYFWIPQNKYEARSNFNLVTITA